LAESAASEEKMYHGSVTLITRKPDGKVVVQKIPFTKPFALPKPIPATPKN
jgi:hypothetical protein